jgi:hypothetical protein
MENTAPNVMVLPDQSLGPNEVVVAPGAAVVVVVRGAAVVVVVAGLAVVDVVVGAAVAAVVDVVGGRDNVVDVVGGGGRVVEIEVVGVLVWSVALTVDGGLPLEQAARRRAPSVSPSPMEVRRTRRP